MSKKDRLDVPDPDAELERDERAWKRLLKLLTGKKK